MQPIPNELHPKLFYPSNPSHEMRPRQITGKDEDACGINRRERKNKKTPTEMALCSCPRNKIQILPPILTTDQNIPIPIACMMQKTSLMINI